MLAGFAGTDFALSPGDETERFSDAEAVRMIEGGFAVPVSESPAETAVTKPAREKRG